MAGGVSGQRPTRSFADVRKVTFNGVGKNAHLTLPKEISHLLEAAGIEYVRVTTTDEGILITPYREPELPGWAKTNGDVA